MTGIIILAAGSSSRFGKPKQNLVYQGQTLLQRAIETASQSTCKQVIVVLGANYDAIKPTLEGPDINTIKNAGWYEGMASSIRSGLKELQKTKPNADSVIFMLCDQPFVDTSLLEQLIERKSSKGIIASGYNNTIGPPVLFNEKYFDELLLLKGQEGAKKLIMKYPEDVFTVNFPLAGIDIDTMEDFEKL